MCIRSTACTTGCADARELFEIAKAEKDDATLVAIDGDTRSLEKTVADMEFRRMFSNPLDPNNCFLDIQAGAGGTEAQDWAQMLMRMYTRYCERKGYKVELLEESPRGRPHHSASLKVNGATPTAPAHGDGIHRLCQVPVRRHSAPTSFASVFVYPESMNQESRSPADLPRYLPRIGAVGTRERPTRDRITHLTHTSCNARTTAQHRNKASNAMPVASTSCCASI